jgi:hypothetical protein
MNTEPLTSGCVKKPVVKYLCYSLIRKSGQKKLKFFSCLRREGGRRCTAPLILKHCDRWRRMVNITLRPLSSPRNNPGSYWTGEDAELFIKKYALLCDLNLEPLRQSLQGADRSDSNWSNSDLRFHHCVTLKLVVLGRINKAELDFQWLCSTCEGNQTCIRKFHRQSSGENSTWKKHIYIAEWRWLLDNDAVSLVQSRPVTSMKYTVEQ